MRFLTIIFVSLFFCSKQANAQPFKFNSVGIKKPFSFHIGWQNEKGGYVWYDGQKTPIPLKLKSYQRDTSQRQDHQPDIEYYKWTEIFDGKATGEYKLTLMLRTISDVEYLRYKDQKTFRFEIDDKEKYEGKNMALLHGVQFHFYTFFKDNLNIKYPDSKVEKYTLNEVNENKPRYANIDDYNFDGVDDIAFSVADDEGLHVANNVFIYNPKLKRFFPLKEPQNSGCGYFSNLKINKQSKKLSVTCKSGASWKSYTFKFNKAQKLVLQKQE
ncbi:XAC2610-related protein [Pedobacter nototheniae]|uniref:XAC2610-related protein n=1 Tax=Pedobacter nototheniae TaxID=2488994 RepID=UPI00292DE1BD|nr:hypothetical protein [Pedobacter nototheniae]